MGKPKRTFWPTQYIARGCQTSVSKLERKFEKMNMRHLPKYQEPLPFKHSQHDGSYDTIFPQIVKPLGCTRGNYSFGRLRKILDSGHFLCFTIILAHSQRQAPSNISEITDLSHGGSLRNSWVNFWHRFVPERRVETQQPPVLTALLWLSNVSRHQNHL